MPSMFSIDGSAGSRSGVVLLAALLSAGNAFFRYGIVEIIDLAKKYQQLGALQTVVNAYGNNSNSFLEAQWYMFAAIALFGAAYTLKVNEHVRVDLIYGGVSERTRTWIDLFGSIFCLVPFCLVMIYVTWPWFLDAWRTNEMSTNAGGLLRWPVKLITPVGFALVLAAGRLRDHQVRRRAHDGLRARARLREAPAMID